MPNLQLSLIKALTLWPTKEAVIDGTKRFTYAQLGDRVGRLANYLLSRDVEQGTVVAILAPNCHEYMEAYYACAALGAVANPLNFRLAALELETILKDSGARVLIFHEDFAATAMEILEAQTSIKEVLGIHSSFESKQRPDPKIEKAKTESNGVPTIQSIAKRIANTMHFEAYESALANTANATMPAQTFDVDHLCHLYYTSGTTGKSKGVMLTHLNVCSNALGAVAELKFTDSVVWGHFAPIFHLADAWAIFALTWVGGTHVYIPYFKAVDALAAIQEHRIEMTALVPTMANQILACEELSKTDVSSLKLVMTAGSPIAPEQVKRIMKELDCDYCQFYGLTETSPFLTIGTIKNKLKSLDQDALVELKARTGRPFIATEVKVVRPDGTEVQRNNSEVGEIIARGPNVMKGYWNKPEATAEAIKDGWFHSGDLAVVDEEGYINIVDRQKDMIISGGENIYSTEVEYCLYEHEAVLECAVFGIPDDKWGESVKAVVVLKAGLSVSERELIAHVRQRLAGYKAPRSLEFAAELPKTGSGKIFKKGLRDQYWQSKKRAVN
jgi:acyl-CoA synthetase (AMP-forming)/AMP-acid ligase II